MFSLIFCKGTFDRHSCDKDRLRRKKHLRRLIRWLWHCFWQLLKFEVQRGFLNAHRDHDEVCKGIHQCTENECSHDDWNKYSASKWLKNPNQKLAKMHDVTTNNLPYCCNFDDIDHWFCEFLSFIDCLVFRLLDILWQVWEEGQYCTPQQWDLQFKNFLNAPTRTYKRQQTEPRSKWYWLWDDLACVDIFRI